MQQGRPPGLFNTLKACTKSWGDFSDNSGGDVVKFQLAAHFYWTLVTLPVASCAAQRALSRLKIIKNRLRSTMSDEWMSDLMVLAAAKDRVSCISCDAIIDSFASLSDHLKRRLLFV